MAWNEKDLTTDWIKPVRIPDGEDVTLSSVRSRIQDLCDRHGIPVAFSEGQLKTGGLFNKRMESIMNMFNPQQNDYLSFVIRVEHMGSYAFMHVYNMGGSRNYGMANAAGEGSTLARLRMNLGGGRAKLNAEENYYAILKDCVEGIFA